jgi:membrane-associated phospholipid phosphatase
MRAFFKKIIRDMGRCFAGRNLLLHALAIGITYILVSSGFDWIVVRAMQGSPLRGIGFLAGSIGFFLPVLVPLILFSYGLILKRSKSIKVGLLLIEAEIIGLLLSFFYKFFSGRPGPIDLTGAGPSVDLSHTFRFGLYQGGVFFGWPSSHVTVAVAAVLVLVLLYKKNVLIKYLALAYGLFMFLGASTTFHWFSDGVAGLIFGALIGTIVAKSESKSLTP